MKRAALCLLLAGLIFALAPGVSAAEQGKAFLWDGSHWGQVSQDAKVGYVFGLGNLADFEVAARGPNKTPCISAAFVGELKRLTVMRIVQEVDKYYQEHPDKTSTPVIEVVLRRCTSVCPPEPAKGGKK
jgi:hypothetical protein